MILPYIKLAQAYNNKYTKSPGKAACASVKRPKTRRKKTSLLLCDSAAQFHCRDIDCFACCIQKNPPAFKRPSVFWFSVLQKVKWGIGVTWVKILVPFTDLISTSSSTGHPLTAATQTQGGNWNSSSLYQEDSLKNSLCQWAQIGMKQVIPGTAAP